MPDNALHVNLAPAEQVTRDGIQTLWVEPARLIDFCVALQHDPAQDFALLLDITAVDERTRRVKAHDNAADFTEVYHFLRPRDAGELRIKVALRADSLNLPSLCALWPNANWYEREVWDMFGIKFKGHPDLRRILMYEEFKGHALRKDYPVNKRQPLIGPQN